MKTSVRIAINLIGKYYIERNLDELEAMETAYDPNWTKKETNYIRSYAKSCAGSLYAPPVNPYQHLYDEAFK